MYRVIVIFVTVSILLLIIGIGKIAIDFGKKEAGLPQIEYAPPIPTSSLNHTDKKSRASKKVKKASRSGSSHAPGTGGKTEEATIKRAPRLYTSAISSPGEDVFIKGVTVGRNASVTAPTEESASTGFGNSIAAGSSQSGSSSSDGEEDGTGGSEPPDDNEEPTLSGAPICVCSSCDFDNLGDAVSKATSLSEHVEIRVAMGTHTLNGGIKINGADTVEITGGWEEGCPDGKRTIDPGLTVLNIEERDIPFQIEAATGSEGAVTIDGFTITGGDGGGIIAQCNKEDGVLDIGIKNNVIKDNTAAGAGAGIMLEATTKGCSLNALVERNVVSNNVALREGGGGISVASSSGGFAGADISNNVIRENGANEFGGGIFIISKEGGRTFLTAVNNIIEGNSAINGGGINADAVGNSEVNLRFVDNLITRNRAQDGGGVSLFSLDGQNTLVLEDNLILINEAKNEGGGIHTFSLGKGSTSLVLKENTISQNTASRESSENIFIRCEDEVVSELISLDDFIEENTSSAGVLIIDGCSIFKSSLPPQS